MCISTSYALSNFCTTSLFLRVSIICFFSLKMSIFCVRTKDLSINLVLLPLSISKPVFILATLVLNIKCLLSIFSTLSCTTHVETLTCLVLIVAAQTLSSTQSFFTCPWSQFWSRTRLFMIQNQWPPQLELLLHSTQLSYWSIDNTYYSHGDQTLCIPNIFPARRAWRVYYLGVFLGWSSSHTTFLPSWLLWWQLE